MSKRLFHLALGLLLLTDCSTKKEAPAPTQPRVTHIDRMWPKRNSKLPFPTAVTPGTSSKTTTKEYKPAKDRSKELLDSIMRAMPDTTATAKPKEHIYARYRNKTVKTAPYDPIVRMREIMSKQTGSTLDNIVYPDYYGGAYMSGNRIVVLITEKFEGSSEVEELKKELKPAQNIVYRTCKNTYNSLHQVQDSIIAQSKRATSLALNIGMCCTLENKNKVGVHLIDASKEKQQELFDAFGKDKVMIIGSGPITFIDH